MININLMPWRETERIKQKQSFLVVLISFTLLTLVALLIIHFSLKQAIVHQKQRNQILLLETQNVEHLIAELENSKNNFTLINQQLSAMEKIYNNRNMLLQLLYNVDKLIPDNIRLTAVKFSCQGIAFIGTAISNEAISQFMQNIANSKLLAKPELNEIRVSKQPGITNKVFDIKVPIKNMSC